MFVDFMGVCFDQIFNQAAKFRYMFGGKAVTPMVIRTMYGAGIRAAAQHSQALYPIFTHIPGLKVVVPSTPYDAKGLLIQAIRDDDPVIFFEHKVLYTIEGDVPEEPYAIPFGEANIVREGGDVTDRRARAESVHGAGRRPSSSRPTASSARSSTRARPRRSTRTRSSRASRRPAGSWSSTRPTRAAAWPPTSSALVAQEAFGSTSRPPPQMVTAAAHAGPVLAGPRGRSTSRAPTGSRRRSAPRPERAAPRMIQKLGDAQVGPLDDRGQGPRVARRRGRRARGRRRDRRGRDREDQRRRRGPGGRRAAPPRRRARRRDPGRRPARRDRRRPRSPDAEIDAFVAEFQASFVPGEAEEDAGGPSAETIETAGGPAARPRPGRGRRGARAPARLRRRPENWRFNLDGAGRGSARC